MVTIDKDKVRESVKKHIQLRLETGLFCNDVCESVWEEMFGNIGEGWTDEDDEKAYQMFNTIYKKYMDGMLKVLTS